MQRSTPVTGLHFGIDESGLASACSHVRVPNTSRIREELKILCVKFSNQNIQKSKQAEVSVMGCLPPKNPNLIHLLKTIYKIQ